MLVNDLLFTNLIISEIIRYVFAISNGSICEKLVGTEKGIQVKLQKHIKLISQGDYKAYVL